MTTTIGGGPGVASVQGGGRWPPSIGPSQLVPVLALSVLRATLGAALEASQRDVAASGVRQYLAEIRGDPSTSKRQCDLIWAVGEAGNVTSSNPRGYPTQQGSGPRGSKQDGNGTGSVQRRCPPCPPGFALARVRSIRSDL
jgi:hypothetical protein